MADETLKIYKPLTTDDVHKGYTETYTTLTRSQSNLAWYLVDRSDDVLWSGTSTDYMKNLFHSFGISREDDNDWFKALNGVTDYFNAKRMLIIDITTFNDGLIDGNTLTVNVPTGTTLGDHVTFYGSNYVGSPYKDQTDDYLAAAQYITGGYGGAVCYLFGKTAGTGALNSGTFNSGYSYPYSGNVNGETHPNLAYISSWEPSATKTKPHLKAISRQHATDGVGYDMPYGLAFLEKGIIVLFDYTSRTDFIGDDTQSEGGEANIGGSGADLIWTGNNVGTFVARFNNSQNSNANIRQNIQFTGATGTHGAVGASVSFKTITKHYGLTYFCHAGPGEFNSTSNHTYNHEKAYFVPSQSDSLYISEVALYGEDTSVGPLAFAKISPPVKKDVLESLTFKVSLNI